MIANLSSLGYIGCSDEWNANNCKWLEVNYGPSYGYIYLVYTFIWYEYKIHKEQNVSLQSTIEIVI